MPVQEAIWVRDLYDYDPETGVFLWRNPPVMARRRAAPGRPAGTVDHRSGHLLLRLGGKLHEAGRIAWLYVHGEWPDRQVHLRDASVPLPEKYRLTNLRLVGEAHELTADRIREVLAYDPASGKLTWRVKRRGIKAGAPAGTIKQINGRAWRYVRFEGTEYSAARLAWLIHYGSWPSHRMEFKDGDPANVRIGNLAEGFFAHGTRQDEPLTQEEREQRRSSSYRRQDLRRSFGLTTDEYDEMLRAQGGVCASCGKPQTAKLMGRPRRLAVDHDHALGNTRESVRQLLCNPCNASMGSLSDDIKRMANLLIYRAKWAHPGELLAILPQVAELMALCSAAPKERVA